MLTTQPFLTSLEATCGLHSAPPDDFCKHLRALHLTQVVDVASAALALGLERRRAPVSTVLWFWVFACALTGQTDVTTLTDVLSYSLLQK